MKLFMNNFVILSFLINFKLISECLNINMNDDPWEAVLQQQQQQQFSNNNNNNNNNQQGKKSIYSVVLFDSKTGEYRIEKSRDISGCVAWGYFEDKIKV